ncbi:hypothetical protein OIU34_21510 [Pararhizobium sp. BT-229]|uniref:hypothetical protein n=1 Tax=Pararhizobium sp. BT-229 TaxID=2986923 RepID=UPI0021F7EE62|nr:hypothetical protein [Pararhizobium sp. BT-229]MCV9964471.1 hypothetical protein [Pararhizobium sp. BT-229]
MPKYTIDFMNIAPDTMEVQRTDTLDVSGLVIPDDAMQFVFFDEDLKYVAPSYFVTDEIDIGELAELRERHPDAPLHYDPKGEAKAALVSWSEEPGAVRTMLVPLLEFVAVIERKSGEVVWPK